MSLSPGLIVICGPTATGKSKLALILAERLQTVILSADSRQVYRDFNIGTAKPTWQERQQIPHYLIDICHPTETLTVGDYQQQAVGLIETLHSQGKVPLLVGGTGLYIKAIVRGFQFPRVPPQEDLRAQLVQLGQVQCYQLLGQVDREAARRIHRNDAVRTLRALEVYYVTGRSMSSQQGEAPPAYPILQLGLDCDDRALVVQRITQRTEQMFSQNFVDEVQQLCDRYGYELPLLNTLGYGEVKQFLNNQISLQEAKALTIQHTAQFAKRQRTWFRALPEIAWVAVDRANWVENVWSQVQNFLG